MKFDKSGILLVFVASFLGGIFCGSFLRVESYWLYLILVPGIAVFVLGYKNKKAAVAFGVSMFFVAGLFRLDYARHEISQADATLPLGFQEFRAKVIKEPEIGDKYQRVTVQDEKGSNFLLNSDLYPIRRYGDVLDIRCEMERPRNYENSNFDYRMYLAKDEILRICNQPQIELIGERQGNLIYIVILDIKNSLEGVLSKVFPDPEGAYLKGLLLGGSSRLSKELEAAFSRTGTTHTVAVSGFNVTIIAAFMLEVGILLGLWRKQAYLLAFSGIVIFVLLTGSPSSAVRAGIMANLLIWAMKEGRLANSTNAILLTAVGMLIVNPMLLRYDAGLQLSFLATLGIVWLYPLLEKKFWQGRAADLIRETLVMSICAQLFVLPVILASFETLSLVSPFANLLILPAIPFIMASGFLAGMAGFVSIPLGKLIGFLPYVLLKIELIMVQLLAGLSWSAVEIKNFRGYGILAYYALLAGSLIWARKKAEISRPIGVDVQ